MGHLLLDLVAAIQSAADIDDLRERLIVRATKHFQAARGALFLHREMPPTISVRVRENPMFKALAERHAPLHDGNIQEIRAMLTRDDHGHALIGPVIENGELVGTLAFTRRREDASFTETDIADLSALCLHVSTRLTHFHLQQGLLEKKDLNLSGRETQIAHLVAQGLTNQQIAAEIGVSSETVKAALKGIFRKAGVHSRAQLVACLPKL